MSLLNLPGSVCGCGAPLGLPRPLPAPVWVRDTRGTPSPAGPGSVHVTGRAVFLSLACHPGQAAGVWTRGSRAAPRNLSHVQVAPSSTRPVRARGDLPDSVAAAGGGRGRGRGGGVVRARSANLGATKPQTAKLGSPGVRPSPDPLPPWLRPLSPRPQSPAPRQSLPYLPRQQRPRWRRLDRASCKSPGAPRVAGGRAGRPTGAGAPPAAATPGPFQA